MKRLTGSLIPEAVDKALAMIRRPKNLQLASLSSMDAPFGILVPSGAAPKSVSGGGFLEEMLGGYEEFLG